MKVENNNGIGNPYHNDENGEFTSKDKQFGSEDEELESLIFGNEEEDLESLIFDNSNFDGNEIDDLFAELSKEDGNGTKINNVPSFSTEELNDLSFQDAKDVVEAIPGIDLEKISSLSEEEVKKLIICQKMINEKQKDNYLEQFNTEKFYGGELWLETLKPSDYEEKKKSGSYENKLNYFKNFYLGNDKEEKIAKLEKFKELGEKYISEKEKFNLKYKEAQDYLDQFRDSSYAYSQERKDNAIWVKDDNLSQSSFHFQDVADKVFEKLKLENPKALKSVEDYTGSYKFINEPLRGLTYYGSFSKKAAFVKEVENITYAIDQSAYEQDVWLQRGTSKISDLNAGIEIGYTTSESELKSLVGKTFKDQGFVSCGAAKGSGFSGDIIMNLYCPRGTKMLYVPKISEYSTENEMIIQRGYSYKITKAERASSYGTIYLDVEVILGSDNEKYDTNKLKELQENNFS